MGTFRKNIILCEPNDILLHFTDYLSVTFDQMVLTEKKNYFHDSFNKLFFPVIYILLFYY